MGSANAGIAKQAKGAPTPVAPFALPFDGVCGLASTGAIAGMSTRLVTERRRKPLVCRTIHLDQQRISSPLRVVV